MLKRISKKAFIDKFGYDPFSASRWLFGTSTTIFADFSCMFNHYTCFSFLFRGKEHVFKKDKRGNWRIYERDY